MNNCQTITLLTPTFFNNFQQFGRFFLELEFDFMKFYHKATEKIHKRQGIRQQKKLDTQRPENSWSKKFLDLRFQTIKKNKLKKYTTAHLGSVFFKKKVQRLIYILKRNGGLI